MRTPVRSIRHAALYGGATLVLTAGLSLAGCSDDDGGEEGDLDATVTEVSSDVSEAVDEGVSDVSEVVDDAEDELDDDGR
jgi:hypothetical protein